MSPVNGGSGGALGRSRTSVCVSSSSKMRSDAAIACCRFALTRDSFLIGPYINNSAATNDVNSPGVRLPKAISRLPYHSAPAIAMPPRNSINGGNSASTRVTFRLVRNSDQEARSNLPASRRSAPKALTMR